MKQKGSTGGKEDLRFGWKEPARSRRVAACKLVITHGCKTIQHVYLYVSQNIKLSDALGKKKKKKKKKK